MVNGLWCRCHATERAARDETEQCSESNRSQDFQMVSMSRTIARDDRSAPTQPATVTSLIFVCKQTCEFLHRL